jgi:photosystem II stability/assembly factor-like uncharacterized protein
MQKILLIFSLATLLLHGQQNWKWQNPLPQGKAINEISIVDSSNVYAAGDNGLILKTVDGGLNWEIIETGYPNNLRTLFFTDQLNGWACGENGIILRTTDGGINFIRQDTGTGTLDINSVFFTSPDRGFAACSNGTLLNTSNGGLNWIPVIFNPQPSFSRIYFVNNDTGWLIGGNGLIKKSTDGGVTWIDQNSEVNNIISSICFIDPDNGWICGQNGLVLKTTNGGNNWNNIYSSTSNWLLSISFIDKTTGISVGRNGILLRTEDGGNSWNKQVQDSSLTFNFVSFLSLGTGWIAGSSGFLAKSIDAGLNWDFQSSGDRVNMNSIFFISQDLGFIVGDKGRIYKTTDGGNTWIKKESNTDVNLNDISYYNHYHMKDLWIAGNNATVLRSTDFGETWIKYDYKNLTTYNLYSISAIGSLYCIVVGEMGTLLQIQILSGFKPYSLKTGFTGNIRNLFLVSPTYGFCVGESIGNGQGTFTNFSIGYNALHPSVFNDINPNFSVSDLNQVTFLKNQGSMYSSKIGFVVGRFGILLRTTDLGKTWNKSTVDITEGKGVYFVDSLNGFICGSNGDILSSSDAGNSWTKQSTHMRTTLSKLYFQNIQTGWVIGPNGLIMKTDNGGGSNISGINNKLNKLPNNFSLSQNYPNPFNPGTIINYSISSRSQVLIRVYNILGKSVLTLVNEKKEPGNYNIYFDGSGLSSGIYFYRIQAGDFSETRKMILLK